jgi:hypothetical protein
MAFLQKGDPAAADPNLHDAFNLRKDLVDLDPDNKMWRKDRRVWAPLPTLNAGRGAVFTRAGTQEMDAAAMGGREFRSHPAGRKKRV